MAVLPLIRQLSRLSGEVFDQFTPMAGLVAEIGRVDGF